METHEPVERELPGLREMGGALTQRARENPLAAVGIALAAGYVLGGGLFSRSSRWLARAAIGALAVPRVRQELFDVLRRRPAAEAPF